MMRTIALLPIIPVAAAVLVALPSTPARARESLVAWAAVPALLVAMLSGPVEPFVLPWALLETHVGLDSIARVWLFFTALLWTAAGFYARTYLAGDPAHRRFALFYLLTLAGNLGLIVAQDVASFYLGFALMTFAGYGLVVHAGGAGPRRAGRVYLVMAVLGETMLLAGLILAATFAPTLAMRDVAQTIASSPQRDLIVGLLLAGFGIKAGAVPLHMWLPLAHPVAPTPASAVLSGAMIKAGLLGWLRFLPLGAVALPGWGAVIIGFGIAAAFFGVVVGIGQRDPKTTLAYSSISQMGFLNIGVGAALAAPQAWPAAVSAVLAYAVHHGMAKGALFLGVGVAAASRSVRQRRIALAGLSFAALSIAGAPLTSGSVAKGALKSAAHLAPVWWPGALDVMLPLAALGSTMLMARFLLLVARDRPRDTEGASFAGLAVPWSVLLLAVAGVMWVLPGWYELDIPIPRYASAAGLWVMIWPIIAGAIVMWLSVGAIRRAGWRADRIVISPGDVLIPVERAVNWVASRLRSGGFPQPPTPVQSLASRWYGMYADASGSDALSGREVAITRWRAASLLVLVLISLLVLALGLGS
jgi:formate hydrogenlyase subunit 3/multisubunit Na+/H+ antiporter MnhD subunit